MDLTPLKSSQSLEKKNLIDNTQDENAIKYLIDSDVEQQRLARWQQLLPQLPELKNGGKEGERRLITAVRKGVQDSLRHKIWPQLIQKPLKYYDDCKNKCELKDINLDLERTFPNSKDTKILCERMKIVLNALAYAIPQVGYCQGMNFIVGTLLLRVSDEEAFNMAYHIFHWEGHEKLLTDLDLIHEKLYALDKLIKKHYPQLSKHLKNYEVDPIVFASSWFITLFCNCFPASYAFRILECILLEGQKVIYRVALQILKMKKHALKQMNQVEDIVDELKNYDELIESNIDSFFDGMYSIHLSRFEINQHKLGYKLKHKPKQMH